MAVSPAPLATALRNRLDSQVFCPTCSHAMDDWEVHLLKYLDCSWCGNALELGTSIPVALAVSQER